MYYIMIEKLGMFFFFVGVGICVVDGILSLVYVG